MVPVCIVNTCTLPVKLHEGMKVATAEMIVETSINNIGEVDKQWEQTVTQHRDVTLQTPLRSRLTGYQGRNF